VAGDVIKGRRPSTLLPAMTSFAVNVCVVGSTEPNATEIVLAASVAN